MPTSRGTTSLRGWEWGADGMGVRVAPKTIGGMVGVVPANSAGWLEGFTANVSVRTGDARFAQQAGWMATQKQVRRLHHVCPEGFLPPDSYSATLNSDVDPHWYSRKSNTEFWSGGYNMFGEHSCVFARVIDISSKENFARHLIFHSSRNKQMTKTPAMLHVSDIYGDLLERRAIAESWMKAQQ